MDNQNNSTEPKENSKRLNVDIGIHLDDIIKAASEDSAREEKLYTVPEYVREIVGEFLMIRHHQRKYDQPLLSPSDIRAAIISGDFNIVPKKIYKAVV